MLSRSSWAIGIGIFAIAYAAGLIITLPATLIDAGIAQASRGIVRLADAQGSLWSGSGQLEIREKGRNIYNGHSLEWRIRPWFLLRAQLAFDIRLDQSGRPAPLTISFTRAELTGADLSLPAAVVGLIEPKLAPFRLGGELSLHVTRLTIGRNRVEGNAVLHWRDAASALTTVSPLGNYALDITGSGSTIHGVMRTLQGPLQMDGQGSLTTSGRIAFAGTASVPAPLQQQMAPLLRLFAIERSEGNFDIQLR